MYKINLDGMTKEEVTQYLKDKGVKKENVEFYKDHVIVKQEIDTNNVKKETNPFTGKLSYGDQKKQGLLLSDTLSKDLGFEVGFDSVDLFSVKSGKTLIQSALNGTKTYEELLNLASLEEKFHKTLESKMEKLLLNLKKCKIVSWNTMEHSFEDMGENGKIFYKLTVSLIDGNNFELYVNGLSGSGLSLECITGCKELTNSYFINNGLEFITKYCFVKFESYFPGKTIINKETLKNSGSIDNEKLKNKANKKIEKILDIVASMGEYEVLKSVCNILGLDFIYEGTEEALEEEGLDEDDLDQHFDSFFDTLEEEIKKVDYKIIDEAYESLKQYY